ncbi:MAG TPA: flagellar basal body L-ring protein FlgH [Alphaproteobacteria bacterium]|nr:flagellar basal body L-ring protein FlgH [Alphaproteobacteria bacterium]
MANRFHHFEIFGRFVLLASVVIALAGCNAFDRLSSLGDAPTLSPITNPTQTPGYVPVSMPMPPPSLAVQSPNSLWQTGARAFFRDQRASRVGDILTVLVTINDQAQLQNETKRSRQNSDTANLTNFFGFESHLHNWFPKAVNPASLVDAGSDTANDGKGTINRQEQINLQLAATIVQVLPNGNLVIEGSQQVVVNYDIRVLKISGVIRPQDIDSSNQISYNQIAEARIEYGGKGEITDVQQPRYGDQLFDILMPF